MRAHLRILVLSVGLAASSSGAFAAGPHKPAPLLVVFPIFGDCPPEMELPWAEHLAESLLLALPADSLRVTAQEPTGTVLPGAIEPMARQRGAELEAAAVMWAELIPSGPCQAPRMIRLRILELASDALYTRELCPERADRDDISRAMALAAVTALRAGEVGQLRIPQARTRRTRSSVPRAPRCPKCRPCPDCPPCATCPPPPPQPHPSAAPVFVTLGAQLTSHPKWSAPGLGAEAGLAYAPAAWLELGLGVQALRGRSVRAEGVKALYSSWPLMAWLAFRLRSSDVELGLVLGGQVAWTRLDALLQRLQTLTTVERINPVVFARARLRYYTPWGFGLQLQAGPAYFIRRQRYVYGTTVGTETVLRMQSVSLEAGLQLVLPIQ